LREKLRDMEKEVEERDGKVDELEQKLFELSGNFPLPFPFFSILGSHSRSSVLVLPGEIAGGRHLPGGARLVPNPDFDPENPRGVRVLQLAQNPMSEWFDLREERFKELRNENDVLVGVVRGLEERVGELVRELESAKGK
jgi:hypothetical protein